MKLPEMRRVHLAHLPTPLEFLPRLSRHLGGPRIYVKRDDQTGLALGGNKARKLEFLVADAIAQGCDMLVTTGGVQSNHARQTAAAAAKLGLGCLLLLTRMVPRDTADYEHSGNVLLDQLLGANIQYFPAEEFSPATVDGVLASLIAEGRKPYFIPIGGSTPLGAVGYAQRCCANSWSRPKANRSRSAVSSWPPAARARTRESWRDSCWRDIKPSFAVILSVELVTNSKSSYAP